MQQHSLSSTESATPHPSLQPQPVPAALAPVDFSTAFFDQPGLLTIAFRDWTPPPGLYHGPHQRHIRLERWYRGPHQRHIRLASAICSRIHTVLRERARLEAQIERAREPVILRQCAFILEVLLISPLIFRAAESAAPLLSDWDCLECDAADLEFDHAHGRAWNCNSCRGTSGPRSLSEIDQLEYLREDRGWYQGWYEDGEGAATWTGIGTSARALLGRHPLTQ